LAVKHSIATRADLISTRSLDETLRAFHSKFADAITAGKKAYSARLAAGLILIELRQRIEAGEAGEGIEWWAWYERKSIRSRRDAEKVMALARAEDPEAAAETARAKNAEYQRTHRAAYVSRTRAEIEMIKHRAPGGEPAEVWVDAEPPLTEAASEADKPEEDGGDSEEVCWRRGLLYRATNAAGEAKYEDWSSFSVDRQLVDAAKTAAESWAKCALYLEGLLKIEGRGS
jgi:hypothetical protein